MKRLLLSLTLLAAAIGGASAQNLLLDDPDNAPYFGARIGVDITSTPGTDGYYNNGAGFTVGGIYNIPLWKNLYFEPGLSIFYDTFSEDIPLVVDTDPVPEMISRSFRNFGFRVPLIAGYHFDFTDLASISVFTGPQINLSLYAHDHYGKGGEKGGSSLFGDHGFKHIDLQWAFGTSVSYGQYVFSVQGAVGMTNIYNFSIAGVQEKLRRNTCTISLGYNF